MKTALLQEYRRARAPYFPKSYPGRVHVQTARTALGVARATIQARIDKARFEDAGGECIPSYEVSRGDSDTVRGAMRIVEHPDDLTLEDLEGDMFNPDACPDINPNTLKREREEYAAMLERDGVWYYVAEVYNGTDWETVDSIGGIEGGGRTVTAFEMNAVDVAQIASLARGNRGRFNALLAPFKSNPGQGGQ